MSYGGSIGIARRRHYKKSYESAGANQLVPLRAYQYYGPHLKKHFIVELPTLS